MRPKQTTKRIHEQEKEEKKNTATIPILGRIIANAHTKVHRHISFIMQTVHKVNLCKSN